MPQALTDADIARFDASKRPALTDADIARLDSTPKKDRDAGFWEGFTNAAKNAARGIGEALKSGNPAEAMARGMVEGSVDQAQKASRDWKAGEHVSAIAHGAAAALPGVGPAAANAGELIGEGRTGEGLGESAFLLGTTVGPSIVRAGAPRVIAGARAAGQAVGRGVAAGGSDFVQGAMKVGAGAAAAEMVPIGPVKHLAALELSRPGLRQMATGIQKGFKAIMTKDGPVVVPDPVAPVNPLADAIAKQAGFDDFASVPKEVQPIIEQAAAVEAERLAQVQAQPQPAQALPPEPAPSAPNVPPVPEGVTPQPLRPPLQRPSPTDIIRNGKPVPAEPVAGADSAGAPPIQNKVASVEPTAGLETQLADSVKAVREGVIQKGQNGPNDPNVNWMTKTGREAKFQQHLKDTGLDVRPDRPEFDPTNPKGQGKFGGGAKTQVNMDAKAERFVKYLKDNKLEPTPDNVARATQALGEADHPSPGTLEKIHGQMGYTMLDLEELLARSIAKELKVKK